MIMCKCRVLYFPEKHWGERFIIGKNPRKEEETMNESTKTKKALRGSLFALFICIALLTGTTFAWFTDTASTGVNKIQSGKLKVGLKYKDGETWKDATTTALKFKKAAGAENEDILWEPGCTYELPQIKVVNEGNLALKYVIKVTGIQGDEKLNEVIDWTVDGNALDTDKKLLANDESDPMTITGHMQESAGNEYQDLSIDGITITVYATQAAEESDSFNNTYDENAFSNIEDVDGLKSSLASGGIVKVGQTIETNNIEDTTDARIIISKPTTLNLDAKIKSPDNMGNNNKNFCALIVDADTTINATKDGGINTGTNGGYALNVRKGATLTINSGDYYGGGTTVQVQEGTLIINGGKFACEPYDNPAYGNKFLINCIDEAYKNGTAKIIIKGGTFVNFDPSDSASENPHGNFVADGYKVVSETHGSDIWYKVVAE